MKSIRKQFPIFNAHPEWVYLDTAATAQKPEAMIDRLSTFYAQEYATVNRGVYKEALAATESYQKTRELAREFINANSVNSIIFTKGTTESLNLLASILSGLVGPGDEILITEAEHHSNIVPWQMLIEKVQARLVVVNIQDNGEIDLSDYQAKLNSKTKIVSVAHISNVLGTIHPIKQITQLAKQFNAIVVVDGAQAPTHISIDVQDLDVDFYAFSAHKMYGPNGVGILYGKEELLKVLPPYQGGGDMIEEVTFEKTTFQNAPLKYEAGTPSIANIIAFGATLEWLKSYQLQSIIEHESALTQRLIKALQTYPEVSILGPLGKRAPIVSFVVSGIHPLDLATWMDLKNIAIRSGHMCAQPLLKRFKHTHVARVSFGIYSTEDDVEAFLKAFESALKIF